MLFPEDILAGMTKEELLDLLLTSTPCPRCGRPDLRLWAYVKGKHTPHTHTPCLSRTDAEEDAWVENLELSMRIAELEGRTK